MPAPAYTENEAAIHEMGHAVLAWALKIPFTHVELRPAKPPHSGWAGQCYLAPPVPRRVLLDGFQLGGPLLQLLLAPSSLAGHDSLFQPSLFSYPSRCMDPRDGFLIVNDALAWGSDLFVTGMMHQAQGWPDLMMKHKGFGGAKPWVLELEKLVRGLLSIPELQLAVTPLCRELVLHHRVDAARIVSEFTSRVDAKHLAALDTFVGAQPA